METRLGQAAPCLVAMEAILAACPPVVDMEAVAEGPCEGLWLLVMPGGSLSLQASPGGLLVSVGCPVLSGPGGRSCHVLYCRVVCLAPEGSWYPLTSPGNFFGGYKSSGCRGRAERTEAKAPEDHLPWPPELPAPPWPPELPAPPWPPELPAPPWPPELPAPPWPPYCLFRSGGPRPVFLSVSVLRGLQSAHPPSRMELLRLRTSLSGGGSYVSPLSCVCHVFPPLVSIFGLFPVSSPLCAPWHIQYVVVLPMV